MPLLPLLPLLKGKAGKGATIIADSKSGVSGAGRTLKLVSHFVEANENLTPYSLSRKHRHVPEMEQEMSIAARSPMTLTFSPHLVPVIVPAAQPPVATAVKRKRLRRCSCATRKVHRLRSGRRRVPRFRPSRSTASTRLPQPLPVRREADMVKAAILSMKPTTI